METKKPVNDKQPEIPEHVDPVEHPFASTPPLEHIEQIVKERTEQREPEK